MSSLGDLFCPLQTHLTNLALGHQSASLPAYTLPFFWSGFKVLDAQVLVSANNLCY